MSLTAIGTTAPEYRLDEPLDPDFAGVYSEISAEDRAYRDRARAFVQHEILPVIDDYWDRADYPIHLIRRLGELDLLRDGVNIEGFPPMSPLAAGLVMAEISRGDGSVGTMIGVQGSLVIRSIQMHGSHEQKRQWLPALARGEKIGAFGLTEPTHGSDSVSLETRAHSVADGFSIAGEKRWIGSGSVGDITVIWARGDDEQVHGYLVPQDSPGYRASVITGKASLRAIWQARIVLDEVHVPSSALLPGATSFRDTSRTLQATRLGVAWAALGHATACYESAVHYARQRFQFGRSLAASPIVQERLTRMLSGLTSLQTLLMQLTTLDAAGRLTGAKASLGKYTATRTARDIAANARDLLGGNGILLENRVIRHFTDIESLHTYEGTESIQALIIGRDITGISAFTS